MYFINKKIDKNKTRNKITKSIAHIYIYNMTTIKDIEEINDIVKRCTDKPNTHVWKDLKVPQEQYPIYKDILNDIINLEDFKNATDKQLNKIWKKYKMNPSRGKLTEVYLILVDENKFERNKDLEDFLISKRCRGISGVTVVTVFLSPYPNGQKFSCNWNCHYCPNEPGQPRSYLFGEPGVLRANQNGFDCIKQMYSRIDSYKMTGHPTDKFEVLILGGTIYSYPKDYLETYMRDIFYAANTCFNKYSREVKSLEEEQLENENSEHKVIGITVETRPDCINKTELEYFRKWGVTRVQLGVQHTDDIILKKVNRGHGLKDTLEACKTLRDNCFKFDIHLMPNLPGSNKEKDIKMMEYVLKNIHPDQVKIYPTETTPFTKILEDYKEGKYIPYGNQDLEEVCLYWLERVHPWIRNNRIVRDIPNYYIVDGVKTSNQYQEFQDIMKRDGKECKCIRCREAGRHEKENPLNGELVVRTYEVAGGTEYFITWESKPVNGIEAKNYLELGYKEPRKALFGFLRLRINKENTNYIFKELEGCGLIRELHVYGRTLKSSDKNNGEVQHIGIGKKLMKAAENIILDSGLKKSAVIAGVGTRNYYRKLGYEKVNTFMIKKLFDWKKFNSYMIIIFLACLFMFIKV